MQYNHEDRKNDTNVKQIYRLASAFRDGNDVVPVKLVIKERVDGTASLYVSVILEKIKEAEKREQPAKNGRDYSPSASDKIISEVKHKDKTKNRYSLGYHAGDLGKSRGDDFWGQGYSRHTGHFGFGTYFVGDPSKLGLNYRRKMPCSITKIAILFSIPFFSQKKTSPFEPVPYFCLTPDIIY